MSPPEEMSPFEQRVRALLEENAQRAAGRVRSRLNQARHAAVAQAPTGTGLRIGGRARQLWLPAAGVAAAVVTFMLWFHGPRPAPTAGARAVAAGDLDLLTDRDGLTLVENGDGEFYEWAVYEAQARQGADAGAGHVD